MYSAFYIVIEAILAGTVSISFILIFKMFGVIGGLSFTAWLRITVCIPN